MPPSSFDIISALGGIRAEGHARAPLFVEVVRELEESDLEQRASAPALTDIKELKSSHHNIARLLAQGKKPYDVAIITGYSPGYLTRLAQSPAFKELLQHYATVEDIANADVVQQMQDVGLEALAILRERQEQEPEKFTIGQLQENIKLLLIEPQKNAALRGAGGGGQAPISIPITFVQAAHAPAANEAIEAEYSMEPRK